jgi:hypothetical protein
MATRAERFRAESERSGPKLPKQPPRKRTTFRSEILEGLSGRQLDPDRAAPAHYSRAAGRKATYALEPTPVAKRPSRKSTRRSGQHQKAAAPLKARVALKVSSPEQRHDRRGG